MATTNGAARETRFGTAGEFIRNMMLLRSDLSSFLTDRRRNIEDECGYPKFYDPRLYQMMFDTEAIANRVVSVLPDECSMVQARIYESDDDRENTPFETDLRKLEIGLQGENTYCFDEEGSALAEIVARADVVAGVGQYGAILIGTEGKGDSTDYSRPLTFRPGQKATRKLLYLSCYPEALAGIASRDSNRASSRFGQPESYHINFDGAYSNSFSGSAFGFSTSSLGISGENTVHWSRVVHVVDNPFSSTVFGTPRQQPVMRRLLDLQKAYAATGEAIWQIGVPGFSVESDPSLAGEVDFDPAVLRESVERYINGFQRWMLSNGFVIKSLSPQISDFTPHMERLLEAICIQLAIPMRVFRGSEIGERASLEDAKRWRVKVASRRRKHVKPRIIQPLLDRLIDLGCVAKPGEGGYHIWWPDVETNTPDEQANISLKSAQALDAYSRGRAQEVMPPFDFLVSQMGLSEDDARRVLDEAEKLAEERERLLAEKAAASLAASQIAPAGQAAPSSDGGSDAVLGQSSASGGTVAADQIFSGGGR